MYGYGGDSDFSGDDGIIFGETHVETESEQAVIRALFSFE